MGFRFYQLKRINKDLNLIRVRIKRGIVRFYTDKRE